MPSEDNSQLSLLINENNAEQDLTEHDERIESQEAWTMGMPSTNGNISTMDSEERTKIEDKNKKFLYA